MPTTTQALVTRVSAADMSLHQRNAMSAALALVIRRPWPPPDFRSGRARVHGSKTVSLVRCLIGEYQAILRVLRPPPFPPCVGFSTILTSASPASAAHR